MTDYYITILNILKRSDGKTNEEIAHEIADTMRNIVSAEVRGLLDCCKNNN